MMGGDFWSRNSLVCFWPFWILPIKPSLALYLWKKCQKFFGKPLFVSSWTGYCQNCSNMVILRELKRYLVQFSQNPTSWLLQELWSPPIAILQNVHPLKFLLNFIIIIISFTFHSKSCTTYTKWFKMFIALFSCYKMFIAKIFSP